MTFSFAVSGGTGIFLHNALEKSHTYELNVWIESSPLANGKGTGALLRSVSNAFLYSTMSPAIRDTDMAEVERRSLYVMEGDGSATKGILNLVDSRTTVVKKSSDATCDEFTREIDTSGDPSIQRT